MILTQMETPSLLPQQPFPVGLKSKGLVSGWGLLTCSRKHMTLLFKWGGNADEVCTHFQATKLSGNFRN